MHQRRNGTPSTPPASVGLPLLCKQQLAVQPLLGEPTDNQYNVVTV